MLWIKPYRFSLGSNMFIPNHPHWHTSQMKMKSLELALKNMKQEAKIVVDSIQPLLEVSLKVAERIGNDQIQISVARTREIINQLKSLRNELSKQTQKVIENKYLDVKFASFL